MSKIHQTEEDKLINTTTNQSQNISTEPLNSEYNNTFKLLNNKNNDILKKNIENPNKNGAFPKLFKFGEKSKNNNNINTNNNNSNINSITNPSKNALNKLRHTLSKTKSFKEDELDNEDDEKKSKKSSLISNSNSVDSNKTKKENNNDDNKSEKSESNNKKNTNIKENNNTNENENKNKNSENEEESESNEEEEEDEQEEIENEMKNNELINRKLYKREKICDTDTEDEESENEKEVPWIILPDNPYKKIWDLFIACIILYSAIVTPYEIAFLDNTNISWFDILIDIVLAIDVVLNFFTAYTDSEENLIRNHKKIIIKYLKSWFIIDFISILPLNYITKNNIKYNKLTRISRLPKLYRLLKLTKLLRMTRMSSKGNVNKITKFFFEKLKINANIERLIFFILTFLLLNHLCSYFLFFMTKIQDLNPDSWVVRLGYADSSNFELYIISFYWTLTTVTTVGYGDITAGTTTERVYNLFIMSFGVLLYSFAIGSLSSIVSTLDQKTEEMNQKLQILSNIKKEFNLDQSIYDKVRKVIKYDLSRNQKDKMNFLQELPNKLRIELSQIMHDKVIQNLYFFKDQPSDFFAYVAPLLKPVKFSQDDYLYKVQDMIDEMYFISKGTVIFCLDKKYGEKEIKEIKKNNNFGEIEMCLNEKLSYNIKIKSRNCELFLLKKSNFLKLSVNFKEFIENFLQKSLMKYLKFNEEKNKMIKEFEDLMNSNENNLINNENKDKNLISNDEDSLSNEIEEKSKTNSNESNGENNSNNSDKEKNKLIENDDKETDKKQSKESNFIKRQKTNLGPTLEKKISYNPNIIQNDLNIDVDNLINEDDKENDEKFIEKCNKIIEYINKSNFNFSSLEEDPRDLLKSLKSETDITTKNIIIDKLENIFKKVFEKDSNLKNNL